MTDNSSLPIEYAQKYGTAKSAPDYSKNRADKTFSIDSADFMFHGHQYRGETSCGSSRNQGKSLPTYGE